MADSKKIRKITINALLNAEYLWKQHKRVCVLCLLAMFTVCLIDAGLQNTIWFMSCAGFLVSMAKVFLFLEKEKNKPAKEDRNEPE